MPDLEKFVFLITCKNLVYVYLLMVYVLGPNTKSALHYFRLGVPNQRSLLLANLSWCEWPLGSCSTALLIAPNHRANQLCLPEIQVQSFLGWQNPKAVGWLDN